MAQDHNPQHDVADRDRSSPGPAPIPSPLIPSMCEPPEVQRAEQEARWKAYWTRQQEIYRTADAAFRKEVDEMCDRILARREAGIPDPIEHKPNEATWDYATEADAQGVSIGSLVR